MYSPLESVVHCAVFPPVARRPTPVATMLRVAPATALPKPSVTFTVNDGRAFAFAVAVALADPAVSLIVRATEASAVEPEAVYEFVNAIAAVEVTVPEVKVSVFVPGVVAVTLIRPV